MDKIEAFKFRNPDALIQAIGQRLRRQRLAMGLTQEELAEPRWRWFWGLMPI